ncbi:MAG: AbrB/MazE/SpoVT family DNA-binding domain-containing protein [Anaerolineales bacterium]|jgi:AbrB family looped-hinge helix DNA binding protein
MSTLTQEPMPYVKIKTKGQVTIPAEFRRDLNLKEGDLLEALVERGGILLKPKTVVDRYDEEWAKSLLEEAQEEAERNPKTPEEEDTEERRLLELGERQAKKLGIKPQDAEKIVDEYRKTGQNKI